MGSPSKYVLVTGCSDGGIGSALAKEFHDRGLHVFATARNLQNMQDLTGLRNVTFLELDVTSPGSVAAAKDAVGCETGGKLDYLVNNSGSGYTMPLLDTDIDTAHSMFEVNVWGVVRVTQAFAPLVVKAKGVIVNNISTAACMGLPFQSMYCGSKAAVERMSEAMALELKPLGVNIVTVMTGVVRTRWFSNVPKFVLPPSSYYAPIESEIGVFSRGEQGNPKMEPENYAQKVVSDVLGGAQGKIWRGALSSIVKIGLAYFPTWLIVRLASQNTGLNKLKV